MRLLQQHDDGQITLTKDLREPEEIPPYAILSHTWGKTDEEVDLQDLQKENVAQKLGYKKILFCAQQAKRDGIGYFWVDTCCIDKGSSAELSESINSMFRWYAQSEKCYVYLSDVKSSTRDPWEAALRTSNWFTRGWTLQELLAPKSVEFFSIEGDKLGDKLSLSNIIHEITQIPVKALRECENGFSEFPTEERMLWRYGRETTREEDLAYSLLGIFGVSMPVIYGEGGERAFRRLKREIDFAAAEPLINPFSISNASVENSNIVRSLQQKVKQHEDKIKDLLFQKEESRENNQKLRDDMNDMNERHRKSTEKAAKDHKRQLERVKNEYHDKLQSSMRDAQRKQQELAALQSNTEPSQAATHRVASADSENVRELKEKHDKDMRELELEYTETLHKKDEELLRSRRAVQECRREMTATFDVKVQKLKDRYDGELRDLRRSYDANIRQKEQGRLTAALRMKQGRTLTAAESRGLIASREESKRRVGPEGSEWRKQSENLHLLQYCAWKRKRQAGDRLRILRVSHLGRMEMMSRSYEEAAHMAAQGAMKQVQNLQRHIQELTGILLNRDDDMYRGSLFATSDLPKTSDEGLRELFVSLRGMVDELSSLPWKINQSYWPEQVINRACARHNPNLLTKAILQDLVWSCLFQSVFCSPFRVFDEEGKLLEREWFGQCRQNTLLDDEKFPWPSPGAYAERWRYLTVRECRRALMESLSELDPRIRLRKGFLDSMERLTELLRRELGNLVDLGAEHTQPIARLAKTAARIWLEFQEHRCRLVVSLSSAEWRSTTEKVTQVQKGPLVLTISPKLGRYGTVKGTEMERWTIIDGCGGESLTIPWDERRSSQSIVSQLDLG